MESVFDVKLASVSQNQLKLGITSQYEIPHLTNSDGMKLAFTRNRELWLYDMNENDMVRVFSFRQEDTDYIRDLYDQHDVRLLNMDEEGNIDFLVYGYMNRGHYEGRVGIILTTISMLIIELKKGCLFLLMSPMTCLKKVWENSLM